MKAFVKRMVSLLLCVAMLAGFLLVAQPEAAAAAHYDTYETLASIKTQGNCSAMQGMAVDSNYVYCLKETDDSKSFITRVNKSTGELAYLTNAANGTNYFYQLYHGNGLAVAVINGKTTLFVATGGAGIGDYSLVRLEISGTTATEVGHYRATYNGSNSYLAGVQVMCVDDTNIHFLFKRNAYIFRGTMPIDQTSGELPMTLWCTLDLTDVKINGVSKDLSNFVQQAVGYYDNKLFVPYSGDSANYDSSAIIVYDLEGAYGTIKSDPDLSFYIKSVKYANFFEIESCGISANDGRLYFATNRRISDSDGNHDGIHYFTDYLYDPAFGESGEPGNFRWETENNQLVSKTTGGCEYNGTFQQLGKLSGNTMSNSRFSLNQTIVLKHSDPWVIEWKSEGWSNHAMLLSKHPISNIANNVYLYRRKSSDIISLGTNTSGQYDNYGIKLSDHGIDGTSEHVYRLTNKVATDGTNMVYLSVDGKELGPMNNYYVGGTSQGTTSDWLNGQDLEFSYMGTTGHYINGCKLSYLQIWGKGIQSQEDDPDIFRWETSSTGMTSVETDGLTTNTTTQMYGSCDGTTYTGYQAKLEKNIVLMHDRPWVLEFQSDSWGGSNLILAASSKTASLYAPYLYRSGSSLMIGYWNGTQNDNYGIQMSDHGIDVTGSHVYRLTNRIASDGSNMIYLSVDGVELGAMNNYIVGTAPQGTSNYLSGKDFTFSYFGTSQHPLSNPISYVQVWEHGIPAADQSDVYRWEPGTSAVTNITSTGYTANGLTLQGGSLSSGTFNDAYYRMKQSVVLLHDKQWTVEWESVGNWKGRSNGALLLSATDVQNGRNQTYLYRRSYDTFIALGIRQDNLHKNYGVSLADHGIDSTVSHVYKLTNKVNSDGSNMVYLSVDGVELGAMNNYFEGGTATGTTSNWVSGKDFVFDFMGTSQFPMGSCSVSYMQIDEGKRLSDTATVKFVNYDGTVISSQTYSYGDTVTVPANPTRPADNSYTYTFAGWDKTVTTVSGDVTYTATYTATAKKYTVVFKNWDGTVISSASYNYGATVTVPANPTKAADNSYTYTFAGWDKTVSTVTGNATYTATYTATARKYTVVFKNWDGSVISSATYNYGATVTVPANPTRPNDASGTYTFTGWDKTVTSVTGNATYTATYASTASSYTVEFVNWDGTVLSSKTYSYGATVTAPANPTRPSNAIYTYTFAGWDRAITTVTGNTTYTAVYTQGYTEYTVRFVNWDGTLISSKVYNYGNSVTTPANPTRAADATGSYTFAGWDKTVVAVVANATYTATYTVSYTNYTVVFKNWDGTVLSSKSYHYGDTVTVPANPTRAADSSYTYTFTGWDKTVTAVTGNTTYTAVYSATALPTDTKPTITPKYPSLTFEDEVYISVYFTLSDATNVVDMGLVTAADANMTDSIMVTEYGYKSSGTTYVVRTHGIPAKKLGDVIYLQVYAKLSDGSYVYSNVYNYSALAYAKDRLANSTDANLKALCVAMLNYGAAAQVQFGYNTDALANASLTADQLALVDPYDVSMMNRVSTVPPYKVGEFTYTNGYTNRYPSISFDGAFSISYYFTPAYTPANGVTLYYWNQATYSSVTVLRRENATGAITMTGTGTYKGIVTGIAAKELDSTIYVAGVYEYDGVTYTTGILPYSLAEYCIDRIANGSATMQALGKATAVYGYYAKQYFA